MSRSKKTGSVPATPKTPQARAAQLGRQSGAERAVAMVVQTAQGPTRISATAKQLKDAFATTQQPRARSITAASGKNAPATVGSMTTISPEGKVLDDVTMYNKIRMARAINGGGRKTAEMYEGYGIGGGGAGGADIGDSANLSSYNFEFPVDAMEQPQSRRQELRYFRLAYDRDPIVSRGIDMHVELTLSKMILEKPKCSVQSFADYVFDWYQGWAQDVGLFEALLHSAREYWLSGEAFPFCEHSADLSKFPLCPIALTHGSRGQTRTPISETHNETEGSDEESLFAWQKNPKTSSLAKKWAKHSDDDPFDLFDEEGKPKVSLKKELKRARQERKLIMAELNRQSTSGARAKIARILRTAAPGDTPAPLMKGPLENLKDQRDAAASPDAGSPDGEGAVPGLDPAAGEGGDGGDLGLDPGAIGGDAPMVGGGGLGGGGGMGGGMDMGAGPDGGAPAVDPHTQQLQRYLKLLDKKKDLLTELIALQDERRHEAELFGHMVNAEYMGPDRVVLLPPDVVEIKRDPRFNSAPTIFYKPSGPQKEAYLQDPKITPEDKETLEREGIIPLNDDPKEGSYVLHFARKKAPFEDHGRSVLQRCMRTIIYREKLRQVQTTLASRNMTPKTLIVAPDAPVTELDALRVHVDEAKADPDYTIVVNYEVTWNEIGSEGRILSLESEWEHTSSEIAIGLGFTPELLAGEGFYSGDRVRVEILNTTYVQFRDMMAELVEQKIFKAIAMRKGFYEVDDFGNPRWIYPKLSFSRLALRDSGDVYDMLYNLYVKNSVPIDVIYEFLNLDPETCRRKIEEDLFTVKDAKMSQALDSIYGGIADLLFKTTDLADRVAKGLTLKTKDLDEQEGTEGSGEGM